MGIKSTKHSNSLDIAFPSSISIPHHPKAYRMSSGPITRRLPPPLPAMAGQPRCPRCNSQETKFCYYNNYNLAQPRHFCKSCRRYWTLGGSLRNIPIGGTTRRNASSPLSYVPKRRRSDNRHSSASSPSSSSPSSSFAVPPPPATCDPDVARTFGALLAEPLPAGFLALGDRFHGRAGFRLGFGGIEDIGFGLGRTAWPFIGDMVEEGSGSGGRLIGGGLGDLWEVPGAGGGDVAGVGGEGSCFGWPDLAISTTTQGKRMQ